MFINHYFVKNSIIEVSRVLDISPFNIVPYRITESDYSTVAYLTVANFVRPGISVRY